MAKAILPEPQPCGLNKVLRLHGAIGRMWGFGAYTCGALKGVALQLLPLRQELGEKGA